MNTVNWGMIGCGDVAESKSGPAFSKVENSSLVAVMCRDLERARNYSQRHKIASYYNNADELINDSRINAVYIATPPLSHEEYALKAIAAGKNVYLEKPMATDLPSAIRIARAADEKGVKLSIAHYRREQPVFKAIRQLLKDNTIGDIRLVSLIYYRKPLTDKELNIPRIQWRINPDISGGGLFHDIAPHQLDLIYYFFGEIEQCRGISVNQSQLYDADDLVSGNILFRSGAVFNGIWFFNADAAEEKDEVNIFGSAGKISFSVFQHEKFSLTTNRGSKQYSFNKIDHVQQPMIEKVVAYFMGKADNPCNGSDGVTIMNIMERFTRYGSNK